MTSPAPHPFSAPLAWSRLRPDDQAWLRQLAKLNGPRARLALVGGAVRDALLGVTPLDLDVVVDGADIQALAQATGLPFVFHPAFQNATVTLPDGRSADLVRARRERYPLPGKNPVPEPGSLEDDLRRRDFTVNALALLVPPDDAPALLDVPGSLDDLRARLLRPQHARSLHEDASRLVRGARLAARHGLQASPELLAQVPDALEVAAMTPRLWAELKLLLLEPRPGLAARTLHEWGAGALLPDIHLLEELDAHQDAGQAVPWTAYAAALLHASEEPAQLTERLALGDRPAGLLARALADTYFPEGTPERVLREVLRPGSYPPLTGRDVLALGVPPGRAVGEALAHLAALRRTGQVNSPETEREALKKYLQADQR